MALEEDLRPRGDITTKLIKSKNEMIKARIIAKQDGIVAGLEFCKAAFKLIGRETVFIKKVSDGKLNLILINKSFNAFKTSKFNKKNILKALG